jgi:hypothetical protein
MNIRMGEYEEMGGFGAILGGVSRWGGRAVNPVNFVNFKGTHAWRAMGESFFEGEVRSQNPEVRRPVFSGTQEIRKRRRRRPNVEHGTSNVELRMDQTIGGDRRGERLGRFEEEFFVL